MLSLGGKTRPDRTSTMSRCSARCPSPRTGSTSATIWRSRRSDASDGPASSIHVEAGLSIATCTVGMPLTSDPVLAAVELFAYENTGTSASVRRLSLPSIVSYHFTGT
ncbi:MAG: hypothetical protein QM820_22870 [Minicystis sp.]